MAKASLSCAYTPVLPPIALSLHGCSNLAEASNVASCHQAWELTLSRLNVLLGSLQSVLKAGVHNLFQLGINLLGCP